MSHEDQVEKFPFQKEVADRFKKWTGLSSPEIDEALRDLTGDTYFEMRKLTRLLLNAVENLVRSGKYAGFVDGKELTSEQRQNIERVDEDLKREIREIVDTAWRSILNKQKIGSDKLALGIKDVMSED